MKTETNDGCTCPRCRAHIPAEFYCRTCGYLPNWREPETEAADARRQAA